MVRLLSLITFGVAAVLADKDQFREAQDPNVNIEEKKEACINCDKTTRAFVPVPEAKELYPVGDGNVYVSVSDGKHYVPSADGKGWVLVPDAKFYVSEPKPYVAVPEVKPYVAVPEVKPYVAVPEVKAHVTVPEVKTYVTVPEVKSYVPVADSHHYVPVTDSHHYVSLTPDSKQVVTWLPDGRSYVTTAPEHKRYVAVPTKPVTVTDRRVHVPDVVDRDYVWDSRYYTEHPTVYTVPRHQYGVKYDYYSPHFERPVYEVPGVDVRTGKPVMYYTQPRYGVYTAGTDKNSNEDHREEEVMEGASFRGHPQMFRYHAF